MLTDAELLERRKYIGASDVSAILGINPWRTPYDVWCEKTDRLELPSVSNDAMDTGNRLEAPVLDWAESRLGALDRNIRLHLPAPFGFVSSQCDALVNSTGNPVEAKTAGIVGPLDRDKWGKEGTDQVPDLYIVQCTVQMLCAGRDLAHLAALLGGRGFVEYAIPLSRALADAILGHCETFWTGNVLSDTPPSGSGPSPDVARYIRRVPNKTVVILGSVMDAYRVAIETERLAKADLTEAKSYVLVALGNAEAGVSDDGNGAVTFFPHDIKGYTVAPKKGVRSLLYRAKGL
jgi:putative phage-type endonuclease